MHCRFLSYLVVGGAILLSQGLRAQDQPATAPALDPATVRDIQARLNQFVDGMDRICNSCTAPLPMASEVAGVAESYIRMQGYRLHTLEQNIKSLDVRWNNYYPLQQWEISQDEGLMSSVERFELLKQEASDSLEVRKQMLESLRGFVEARALLASLDTTYNSMGKKAFELSLTSKTAPLLEKQKQKEQILFATVQEKFDKAKEASRYHLVSDHSMEELEDSFAVIKSKSETIQAMQYKPLIARIKDYLLGLAAVAVLLLFVSMVKAKIKAAKDARENMKKYQETLKLNGQDEYPTI